MSPVDIPNITRNQKILSVGFIMKDFVTETGTLKSEEYWKLQV